jgi:hypothetical protein
MPNFRITRFWRLLFCYAPFLLLLVRWFVFWILETALTQFYDDKDGQRARREAVVKSRDYIMRSAPGL